MEETSAGLQIPIDLKSNEKNKQEELKGDVENERKKNKEPRPTNGAHELENDEGDREKGSEGTHDVSPERVKSYPTPSI
jgi:hypothetical protein